MSVDLVAIDDVCELVRGSSPRPQGDPRYFGGSVPRLIVADMTRDGMYVTPSIDSLTEEGAKQSRPMKAGEVVMVVSGLVGLPSILKIDACIHDGLVGFRNLDKNVMPEYLYYWLLNSQENTRTQTAGAIWQNLTTDQIKEWKLPLPPLTEQKRIASLLARADRLRHLRRTAHELGESLLQSVFLEMFGDPIQNGQKLQVEKLEGFTNLVSSGSTPLGGSNVYTASGIRFIRSQNVLMNKFDFSDIAFISEEIYNSMKRTVVKPNDVLLNITGASIGRVACYQDDVLANVNQHVCIIRCKPEKLNPIYLSYFLSMPSFQEKYITNQSGATRQALNFEQIKDFNISVPPLSLQEEFAGVVARVESLRGRMGESTRQVEGLFDALLAQTMDGGR